MNTKRKRKENGYERNKNKEMKSKGAQD